MDTLKRMRAFWSKSNTVSAIPVFILCVCACTRTQFSETGSCYALKASLGWPPCLAYILPLKANQFLPFLRLFVEKKNPNNTPNAKLALAQGGAHRIPSAHALWSLQNVVHVRCLFTLNRTTLLPTAGDCSWRGRRHFYSVCATFFSLLSPLQCSQGRGSFTLATSTALMLCSPEDGLLVIKAPPRSRLLPTLSLVGSPPARLFLSSLQRLEPCCPCLFFCLLMSLPLGRAGELSSMADMVSSGFSSQQEAIHPCARGVPQSQFAASLA